MDFRKDYIKAGIAGEFRKAGEEDFTSDNVEISFKTRGENAGKDYGFFVTEEQDRKTKKYTGNKKIIFYLAKKSGENEENITLPDFPADFKPGAACAELIAKAIPAYKDYTRPGAKAASKASKKLAFIEGGFKL